MTAQIELRGDVAVLVPAAGLGIRLGPGGPKALRLLDGQPLLVHAVRRLAVAESVGMIVVAAPEADVCTVHGLLDPLVETTVVAGGATRQASVSAALAAVPSSVEIVLVHDAARALAPAALFDAVVAAVRDGHDAVIPVLPVVDTIKEVDTCGRVVGTMDRTVLRAVQTPQGFRREVLVAAHGAAADDHTDDAGLVERLGLPVHTVPGDEAAMKITRPADLVVAEALIGRSLP